VREELGLAVGAETQLVGTLVSENGKDAVDARHTGAAREATAEFLTLGQAGPAGRGVDVPLHEGQAVPKVAASMTNR
jgi:hypothetical protein